MQIGIALQALGPVIAHCFLAFEFSRRLSCDLGNERRRHLKVVGVVRENSIQVVAVPGSNPLGREVISKSPVKHTFCSPVLGTFSYSCLDRSSKVVRLLAQPGLGLKTPPTASEIFLIRTVAGFVSSPSLAKGFSVMLMRPNAI